MATSAETTVIETHSGTLPDEWDNVVTNHDRATVFHTRAWKQTVDRTFNYDPAYVVVSDDETGDTIGVVPSFRVGETVGESFVNPFCEYGYPLVATDADPRRVLSALTTLPGRFDAIICKDRYGTDIRGYYPEFGAIKTGVSFRVPTTIAFDTLWENGFNRDLRSSIRTARDHDLTVTETDDVAAYFELYRQTMDRLGSPIFPQSFFDTLKSTFGSDCRILLVDEDSPKAGLLVLDFGGDRYILSNASDPTHWDERPNELLYCTVIEWACDGEYSVVDFGRTEPESPLYEFKQKFGGTEKQLASFVHPPRYVSRASISGYKQLKPVTRRLGPLLTHPRVGPTLKEWVHE
ncbi:GNAT family N-acetyltransferase [Halomicrobium sp. IBSBa]|uniref:lipid II:glycine glycyltransferase FemX n=1 Tax=Halomicrobium sp. IBSBa TaxID=2778916 RepID=UPI001ABF6867|nr:GNAT family N-acetyltransferase [Halomicrobium sp. IBSBa]MBO4247086.1 GNAT family N-acetyltransferase [Halomicrobium sp. IBSBa]